MQEDMLYNRNQFAEKCRNFVFKRKVCGTPARLIEDWARVRSVELAS
jgi:putative two-component system hydrogenase maturation factor HypX/HoxX